MSELMRGIRERRSIRNFQDRPVPDDLLFRVLEAVRWSPSWANTQCWEIIVVRDSGLKKRLRETVGPGNPAAKSVVAAPVVLVVCGKLGRAGYYKGRVTTRFGDWLLFDLGIATQNLCLAAHELGLGTVIMGLFDHDEAGRILGVPREYQPVALIPLGYPSRIPSAPKRREAAEFTHFERFRDDSKPGKPPGLE